MPLLLSQADAAWVSQVFAYDASPSGYGVCSVTHPSTEVSELVGKIREWFRFKGPLRALHSRAMELALADCKGGL